MMLSSKNFLDINRKVDELKQDKDNIVKVLEYIKTIYYTEINQDTYEKVKLISLLEETIKNLNRNANVDLALDKMIIKICKV